MKEIEDEFGPDTAYVFESLTSMGLWDADSALSFFLRHCSRIHDLDTPVPPIYQPELAAAASVWASEHPRRQVNVAATTAATFLANKVAPGLLDRYLVRTGGDLQQDDLAGGSESIGQPVRAGRWRLRGAR